jgi:hypothetical protein
MKEEFVEHRLVTMLDAGGFKALKLTTPGTNGTMDRMILRPKWSPGAPWFVELKRPGKSERRLQEIVRDDWRARGCNVWPCIDTYELVDQFVQHLKLLCEQERIIRP